MTSKAAGAEELSLALAMPIAPDSMMPAFDPNAKSFTAVAANSFELLDRGAEFTGRGEARSAEPSAEGKPNLLSKAAKRNARRKQKRQEQQEHSTLRASIVPAKG